MVAPRIAGWVRRHPDLTALALLLAALVTMLATLAADIAQRLLDPRLGAA